MNTTMTLGAFCASALCAISSPALADAVQWRVEDGGNGHWYALFTFDDGDSTIFDAQAIAESMGGYVSSVRSTAENNWIYNTFGNTRFGAYQDTSSPDYSEPNGGWAWINGEPWDYTNWLPGEPSNSNGNEDGAAVCCGGRWNDVRIENGGTYLFEWSSDCNGDGIVDYEQILDGTFGDTDGDGVPDCCESGACVDAIQWRIEDGGNGHWYRLVSGELLTWSEANDQATALGGYLATPTSPDENSWIFTEFDISDYDTHWHTPSGTGPALGGFWDAGESAWEWRNGEVWSWNNLIQPLPSDPAVDWGSGYTTEDGVAVPSEQWQHFPFDTPGSAQIYHKSFVVEFTSFPGTPLGACCLDGFCLTSTASDCIANGGTWGGADSSCSDYDCSAACIADFDGDGDVDGADLSFLLSVWGVCP